MNRKAKKIIDKAFIELERGVAPSSEVSRAFASALKHATDGERNHRRFVGSAYGVSVETAARYFVVKWAHAPRSHPKSWRHVAQIRLDCIYGSAVGEMMREDKRLPKLDPEFSKLEYPFT